MKYPRYSRKRTYTKREFDTLWDAYQTLGAILVPLKGSSVKVLDNLADMLNGDKPQWDGKALRTAREKNHRAMDRTERLEEELQFVRADYFGFQQVMRGLLARGAVNADAIASVQQFLHPLSTERRRTRETVSKPTKGEAEKR